MAALPKLLLQAQFDDAPDEVVTLDVTRSFATMSAKNIRQNVDFLRDPETRKSGSLRVYDLSRSLTYVQMTKALNGQMRFLPNRDVLADKIEEWLEAIGGDPTSVAACLNHLERLEYSLAIEKQKLKHLGESEIIREGDCVYYCCEEQESFYSDVESFLDNRAFDYVDVNYPGQKPDYEAAYKEMGVAFLYATKPVRWPGFTPDCLEDFFRPEDVVYATLEDHHDDAAEQVEDIDELSSFLSSWLVSKGVVPPAEAGATNNQIREKNDAALSSFIEKNGDAAEKGLLSDPGLCEFLKDWNARQNIVTYYPDTSRVLIVNIPAGSAKSPRVLAQEAKRKTIAGLEAKISVLEADWRLGVNPGRPAMTP